MKILILEDHPIFRFGLRHLILEKWPDAKIGEASSLIEAYPKIKSDNWDIALVDLNLQDTQGVESVSRLKRVAPDLRILVVSLHTESAYATQILRIGAKGYLNKENATEELIDAIQKVISGKLYISTSLAEHMTHLLIERNAKLPHETLAVQEYRVMLQIASGTKIIQIAKDMSLSPKTISTYRMRILEKMGLTSNLDLAKYCTEHKLN